ncbi:MAG: hypothetical protein BWX90_00067 [bacterium ADurb.Bin132]|nr:MAG: hypothetical protein BWX90_00067 [bacterium ADurb.Bin132]
MKKLCFYVVIFVVAALFSGCGQPTPPGKGGDGSDSGKQAENAEKRIYWFDNNAKTETQSGIVYSVNLGYKDKRQEFGIPKPEPQSNYALKTGFVFYPYVNIVSISKNKEFILFSTEFGKSFDVKNGETYLVDGKKVEDIEVNEYSIYEPSTKEFHYIGASCIYHLGYVEDLKEKIKEVGHKYHPAGWLDDELLLVETTKDEKIYTERQDAAVKVTESNIEVPYATAKAVSFSLKDFTLSPTDKFKPLKPWTSYSDTNTGIVGYFDPRYPLFRRALHIYYPEYPDLFNSVITTLTDFKGEKTYDLYELAKEALPKDYILGDSSFCGAMIDQNGRRMCYYYMEGHHKDILKYKSNDPMWRESYPPIPRREYVVFGLDFDTGKIEKYMDTDKINSVVQGFVKLPIKTGDLITIFARTLDGLTKEIGPMVLFFCDVTHNRSFTVESADLLAYGPKLDKIKKVEIPIIFQCRFIR